MGATLAPLVRVCVHVCLCVCKCVCMYVLVHVCVYVPSMDVIHLMIKVAATVVGGQSMYLKVRPQIRQDT